MLKKSVFIFCFLVSLIVHSCNCRSIRHYAHRPRSLSLVSSDFQSRPATSVGDDGLAIKTSENSISDESKSSLASEFPFLEESTSSDEIVDSKERSDVDPKALSSEKPSQVEATTTIHPDDGELDLDEDDRRDPIQEEVRRDPRKDKVLVILVDGLRSDLVERNRRLKAFKFMSENGVTALKVKPVFPSLTYPNLYTIATGLHPNTHQIIANNMFSVRYNEFFHGENNSHAHWYNRAEPIWVRASRKGKRVASYWWPGVNIELFGRKIREVEPPLSNEVILGRSYDKIVLDRLNKMIKGFKDDTLDFGMIFYEAIDITGHFHGPQSKEIKKSLRRVDKILSHVIEEANELLSDNLTIYVLSDHGMGPVTKQIIIDEYVDFNDIKLMVGGGAFSMLLPEDGKESFVREQLLRTPVEGLNVYSSGRLPIHFHLERAEHLLPIILTADPGFMIVKSPIRDSYFNGLHGWDPVFDEDMYGVMYAVGPDLKSNFTLKDVNMVDHYNLLCHLLGMRPRENHGDWLKMEKSLKPPPETALNDDYENDEEYAGFSSAAMSKFRSVDIFINFLFLGIHWFIL